MIEIVNCSGPATIQDLGRVGFRHLGVPLSGALDPRLLRVANALVGNTADAAAIEMRLVGPKLCARQRVRIGLAGEVAGQIESAQGDQCALAPWRSHTLEEGDTLTLGVLKSGVAYLAVFGGIEVPVVLGSRSTYTRARIGGLDGRQLAAGDCLPTGQQASGDETAPVEMQLTQIPILWSGLIRVLPGPQQDHFTDEAWATFLASDFTVGKQADRMGLRLQGETLVHAQVGADIVSDAVLPGAIQVPADGQPIVLLADCQTVGGYPKLATVISADLPKLAHALPGTRVRFATVTREEADSARREEKNAVQAMLCAILPMPRGVDLNALYVSNLISGVIYEN